MKMKAPVDVTTVGGGPHQSGHTGKDIQAASATVPGAETTAGDLDEDVEVFNKLPTIAELKVVADLPVLEADGKPLPFKTLYSGNNTAQRVLVIFVRQFFCGICQEYLRTLSSSITPEGLLALPTATQIVVIGCGQPDLISMYRQTTTCPFPIYADPTRKLYDILGMTRTLDLGPKSPEYMQKTLLSVMVGSFFQGLKSGRGATKGGDYRQVGGEFLFEDGKVMWGHRMRNTRDHTELPMLRKVLGLDDTKPPMRKTRTSSVGRALSNRRQSWSRNSIRTRKSGERQEGSVMENVTEDKAMETTGKAVAARETPLGTVESHEYALASKNGSVNSARGSILIT
ncbi:MAG: hypothetical protein FRX48_08531 [Lasallia pustulata]|uniref:Thioredoxin-like fold n=1 Tax=Lasallia pustulata TaxID=136370 RepID=A0A5M8PF07_9LECA|nr:MAG: hypothetical protein FRX48_08531 [Lasallia pustulata]